MWEAVYFIPVVTIKYFWRSPDLLGFSMRSPLCSLKQKTHSLFLSMRHFLPSGVAHPYLFSWTTVSFFPRFILYLFTRVCVLGAWFFFSVGHFFFFYPSGAISLFPSSMYILSEFHCFELSLELLLISYQKPKLWSSQQPLFHSSHKSLFSSSNGSLLRNTLDLFSRKECVEMKL